MNTEGKYIFKTKNTIAEKYEFKFITTIQTIIIKTFLHIIQAFDQQVRYM